MLVGFLDSGVDVTHPDLVGQVNASASASCLGGVVNTSPAIWANDIIGHGTFGAGIVAAKKNGIGTVGVAPGVQVSMVKVAVDDVNDPNFGLVFPDAVVCGIDWAIAHNVDVLNASLTIDPFTAPSTTSSAAISPTGRPSCRSCAPRSSRRPPRSSRWWPRPENFFDDLANLPGSEPGVQCKVLPVSLPKVIGVSAVGYTQKLSFYSDYGFGGVDLTAPGRRQSDSRRAGHRHHRIRSDPVDHPGGKPLLSGRGRLRRAGPGLLLGTCATYAYIQGTSESAPHVAGVAALIISRFGKMTPDALLVKLSLGATPLACPPSPYDPGQTGQPATCKGPASTTTSTALAKSTRWPRSGSARRRLDRSPPWGPTLGRGSGSSPRAIP